MRARKRADPRGSPEIFCCTPLSLPSPGQYWCEQPQTDAEVLKLPDRAGEETGTGTQCKGLAGQGHGMM